jgi:class 3 adenylate cyclase/TolB-like protein
MAETRKLAAILAADVVGYSRLASTDEERTLARLRALRSDLIDPTMAVHRGRVVKRTGDGLLVEFRSVVDAVRCAIELQSGMAERNAGVPPERRIEFRVGIHLGDVVEEADGDLMGDGVNIAARLEGIARPGAVCLSEDAWRQVRSRLDLAVSDLGQKKLKNIAEPVRVYAVEVGKPAPTKPTGFAASFAWLGRRSVRWGGAAVIVMLAATATIREFAGEFETPHHVPGEVTVNVPGPVPSQPRGPGVAVLPFDNLTGDPSQALFADGLSEQLITALSAFGHLHVLARNTTFAYRNKAADIQELGRQLKVGYVVEGSVRRVGDKLGVTAKLIDARTGSLLWTQTFERPSASGSLLATQGDIAQRIAAPVGGWSGAVVRAELERTRNKQPSELSSDECVLFIRAGEPAAMQSDAWMQRARACAETAIKRDPDDADAWAALERVLRFQRYWGAGLAAPEAADIDKRASLALRSLEAGNRAVELAPDSASAHLARFGGSYATCQLERMRVEADKVAALGRNDATALADMGRDLILAGEPEYGRQLAEKALALAGAAAPRAWWGAIGDYHHRMEEYAEALEAYRKAYDEASWIDHIRIVSLFPYLGWTEEARVEIPALLRLKPDISIREYDRYLKMWCLDAAWRERILLALRAAGLREEADEKPAPQADAAAPAEPR